MYVFPYRSVSAKATRQKAFFFCLVACFTLMETEKKGICHTKDTHGKVTAFLTAFVSPPLPTCCFVFCALCNEVLFFLNK